MNNHNYDALYNKAKHVISDSDRLVSNMANAVALLAEELNHHWIGFYLTDFDKSELYLGPFAGPLACTRIPFGQGVCGTSFERKETLIVENVHEFPGHIACSSETNSEIVVPIFNSEGTKVLGVLDIDSKNFNQFNHIDKEWLEKFCALF